MKGFNLRKISAIICALALVISSITYAPTKSVSAQTYDTLTYTALSSDVAYTYISNGMSANNPELLDAGVTLQIAYSADNKLADTIVTINGVPTANGTGAVTYIANGIVKLNPTLFDNNAYTLVVITSTMGTTEMVVKRGNPTSAGEIPSSDVQNPSQGGEQVTTPSSNPGVEPATTTTVSVPDATSTPVMVQGVVAQTEVGESTIDNSVMVAWASSTDANNAAGYDPTVTSYNVYIYKSNQVVTRIVNATNGSVVGGLSAGNYQAAVAAVNSKGEGTLSDKIDFTVTGSTLNYTYPEECNGPKTPSGLVIITANPEVQPSVGNETNAIEVAWAASSNPQASSYDATVTGYNIYLFDATTGNPYRRVYVGGIDSTYTAIKSVSAGTYLVYLSAVNSADEESALSAPGISLPSKVIVTGETYDNAQDFGYPDQPTLPEGLEINTAGIDYGFSVAWAANANLTGIKLNLFVDGVCIKSGINEGGVSSYYENRLAAGTYTVEIKAQYTSNNVESFPLTKTGVTIATDPGLTTQTPEQLADPSYSGYVEPETTTPGEEPSDDPVQPETTTPGEKPSDDPAQPETTTPDEKPSVDNTTTVAPTTEAPTTVGSSEETTVDPALMNRPGKAKITKATKKVSAKKVKVNFKTVKGATGYEVAVYKNKKNAKSNENAIATTDSAKIKVAVKAKKLKKAKKLFVRVRAYVKVNGTKVCGKWSKVKKVRIK